MAWLRVRTKKLGNVLVVELFEVIDLFQDRRFLCRSSDHEPLPDKDAIIIVAQHPNTIDDLFRTSRCFDGTDMLHWNSFAQSKIDMRSIQRKLLGGSSPLFFDHFSSVSYYSLKSIFWERQVLIAKIEEFCLAPGCNIITNDQKECQSRIGHSPVPDVVCQRRLPALLP